MEEDGRDPKLTELCNERTIQENQRGFFNTLLEDVFTNSRIREWTDDIWKQNMSDHNFISALIKEEDIFSKLCEVFSVEEVYRKKCDTSAEKIKRQAEECNDHVKALELLNQAVTRSSMKNIPALLQLRATCLVNNNMSNLAIKDLQLALKILEPEKSSPMKDTIQTQLTETLKKYKKSHKDDKSGTISEVAFGKHPRLEGASCLIDFCENDDQGRYIVAAKDISVGDTLIVEDPYVSCLKSQHFGSHCHHCFKRLTASIGCPDCCTVAFCCQECCNTAIDTYHKYECKFMDLFIGSGMSVGCHSALRIVTQAGLSASLELFEKHLKTSTTTNKNDQSNKSYATYDTNAQIFGLCTHKHMRKPADYLRRTIMAFFLLRCLQKTMFFNKPIPHKSKINDRFTSDEASIMTILLFALQAIQFNAHEIIEEPSNTHPRQEIALAVFPTSSLFNHDCYPSVIRYFVGKSMVIRAIRPCKIGCPVGDNYGPRFERQTKNVRLRALRSRYWFKCGCKACLESWETPLTSQITLRCPNIECNGKIKTNNLPADHKCQCCSKIVAKDIVNDKLNIIKGCILNYEEGLRLFRDKSDSMKGIELLKSSLTSFNANAYAPHAPTHAAEDTLRRFYSIRESSK